MSFGGLFRAPEARNELGDWKSEQAMQVRYDDSAIFPVVLEENKKDASINVPNIIQPAESEALSHKNPDVEEEVILDTDFITKCSVEAKVRNPSLQGRRDDGDDNPTVRIYQLKREAGAGDSILSLLADSATCYTCTVSSSRETIVV